MNFNFILIVALAIVVGQWGSNRFFKASPKEEVVERTTTGDPVRDFLDNY